MVGDLTLALQQSHEIIELIVVQSRHLRRQGHHLRCHLCGRASGTTGSRGVGSWRSNGAENTVHVALYRRCGVVTEGTTRGWGAVATRGRDPGGGGWKLLRRGQG